MGHLIKIAWMESPSLAFQMSVRYQTPALTNEVRRLALEYPHLAISDPEALHLLLKDGLPEDVGDRQLKVSLVVFSTPRS